MFTATETGVVHPNVAGIVVGQHKFRGFDSDDIRILRKCLAAGYVGSVVIQTAASLTGISVGFMPHSTLIITDHGNRIKYRGKITLDIYKTFTRIESGKVVTRIS